MSWIRAESKHLNDIRYLSVIWLRFLIGHLNLINVWLGEDQRTNIIKTHPSKRLDYYAFESYQLLHTHHWTQLGGPMC